MKVRDLINEVQMIQNDEILTEAIMEDLVALVKKVFNKIKAEAKDFATNLIAWATAGGKSVESFSADVQVKINKFLKLYKEYSVTRKMGSTAGLKMALIHSGIPVEEPEKETAPSMLV